MPSPVRRRRGRVGLRWRARRRADRAAPRGQPAGGSSLLPLDAHVYADRAATTVDDVEALAPNATRGSRAGRAKPPTPTWTRTSPDGIPRFPSHRRSRCSGRSAVRTLGDATATAHRRPYYVEFLAYLALHPNGVTAENSPRTSASAPEGAIGPEHHPEVARAEPRRQAVPPARAADPSGRRPGDYALDGVLCDLDLFRRLRARGQSRGADGMADLVSALHLVSGEPFTDLRKDGWGWLLEGDRLDHIMTAAIVDVGHIVTTHALAVGDLDLADFASNVALAASPYDEIANLDRAAVDRAMGDVEGADARLRNGISNRSDDDYGPIQTPPRTEKSSAGAIEQARRRTG